MKNRLLITLNIILFITIITCVYNRAQHLPMDRLNEQSNYLQSQDLFAMELGFTPSCSPFWLQQWYAYALRITAYAPEISEAYSLKGFYFYAKGHETLALEAYKKSLQLNPHIWSYHYNIGVILYNQGKYAQALQHFESAVKANWPLNAHTLLHSKLFGDLIRKAKGKNIAYQQRLEEGITRSTLALKAAAIALQTGETPPGLSLYPVLF